MLNEKTNKLFEYVKKRHGNQLRKYTGEPYYNHLYNVAKICFDYKLPRLSKEVALCHDLFEDTGCDFDALYKELVTIGYARNDAYFICSHVVELTDVFIKEDYKHWNRSARKDMEAERLGKINSFSQSIKYADLIDNTKSIVKHDKGFAKKYLQEKRKILEVMRDGDENLLKACERSLVESELKLNK